MNLRFLLLELKFGIRLSVVISFPDSPLEDRGSNPKRGG